MSGTELTPVFTFIVGVIGGLLLGVCLCFIWINHFYVVEEDEEANEFEALALGGSGFVNESEDGLTPYQRNLASLSREDEIVPLKLDTPQTDDTPVNQMFEPSSPDFPERFVPTEPFLPISPEFCPPNASFVKDEYSTPNDMSLHLKGHLTMDKWGDSLKNIHRYLSKTENLAGELTNESWLGIGIQHGSERSDSEGPSKPAVIEK